MAQNIWELKDSLIFRQKRRAQLVKRSLGQHTVRLVLDLGCAEGFATNFISQASEFVVGLELDIDYLKMAKKKITAASFINASIDYLPFRDNCVDAVCVLEVLEHLKDEQRDCGLKEVDRVLGPKGVLIISVPYKENIVHTRCVHCEKLTPLYGHLNSFDDNNITALVPRHFELVERYHLPNIAQISCNRILQALPVSIWLLLNNFLGLIRTGYWIVLVYIKM